MGRAVASARMAAGKVVGVVTTADGKFAVATKDTGTVTAARETPPGESDSPGGVTGGALVTGS